MSEKTYKFVLVGAGLPRMYSHTQLGHGNPPEYFRQALGWSAKHEGFATRVFKASGKRLVFRDSGEEVLAYEEVLDMSPGLMYRTLSLDWRGEEIEGSHPIFANETPKTTGKTHE